MQKAKIINAWRSGWIGTVKNVQPSKEKLVTDKEGAFADLLDYLIEFDDGEKYWYYSHNIELLYQES